MTELEEMQTLVAVSQVGQAFEEFSKSDVGRYLIGKSEQEELALLRQLQNTPANDQEKIAQLQLRSKARRLCLEWIKEAINEGVEARTLLEFKHE